VTKVSIISDVHLEFHDLADLPGGDILIMAGDIFLADRLRENKEDADSRKLRKRFERFCKEEVSKYEKAIHVCGNHEHYRGFIEDSSNLIKVLFAGFAPNAVQLDNETIDIGGVTFIGTSLWATCGVGDPMKELRIGGGMNDFHLIKTRDIEQSWSGMQHRKFRPSDANKLHLKAKRFLSKALANAKDTGLPCIVVTHHAPSYLSKTDTWKHADEDVDEAYYSNQHRLMKANPHAKIWIHGHTHSSCRYRVGDTLVVSNQRGYFPSERVSRYFDPGAEDFDLDDIRCMELA